MRPFPRLINRYLKLKSFEKSGRFYEVLGLSWLDKQLCKVFKEAPVYRYVPGRTDSSDRLVDMIHKGQYTEIINLKCFLFYAAYVGIFYKAGYDWLAWLTVIWAIPHAAVVLIERYKRFLMLDWFRHPEALTAPDPAYPEPRSLAKLNHWFYKPRSFENEKFYAKIGMNPFRTYVAWLSRLSEPDESMPQPKHKANTLKSTSYPYLDYFENTTRTSERIHWIGVLQHVPYWYLFIRDKYWLGMFLMSWLLYLNIYSGLLQRQHRSRVFKLLIKKANKQIGNPTQ